MIDVGAIESLEILQNIKGVKSDCLLRTMRKMQTPMGLRMLRSTILQPSTVLNEVITPRLDAVQELTENQTLFDSCRKGESSPFSFVLR
jgi:DNA mismatch repair protein MSH4